MPALLRSIGAGLPKILSLRWMGVGVLALLSAACVPDAPPTTSSASQPPAALFGAQLGAGELANGAPAGVVYFVLTGSPADVGGVRDGDLVQAIGGQPVTSGETLLEVMRRSQPDTVAPVTLVRDGQPLELKVKLGRRPPEAEYARQWRSFMEQRSSQELAAASEAQGRGDYSAALAHGAQAARAAYDASSAVAADQAVAQLGTTLQSMKGPPPVPPEADRRNRRAMAILSGAGTDRDNDRASQEFGAAIFAAPWIADLYLNRGLVLARAGYPREAAVSLRQYLLLKPRAADTAAVRTKIAEFEVASENQQAWRPFLTTYNSSFGGTFRVSLRGNVLTTTVVTPDTDTDQKPGDTICSGTVSGPRFEGKCTLWFKTDTGKNCFGAHREYEADGGIKGEQLQIDAISRLNFNTQTCAINSEERGHRVWVNKAQSSS